MSEETKNDDVYEVIADIEEEKTDDEDTVDVDDDLTGDEHSRKLAIHSILKDTDLEDQLVQVHGEDGETQLLQIDAAIEAAQGLVEEIIHVNDVGLDLDSPSEIVLPARPPKPSLNYTVVNEESYQELQETSRGRVDKDDPRSRLHFVKYMKREGKTVKIWECGICSKEFRHQYTLMRHLPTHTDERNFKCDTCGKAFRQMSTLSQHRAIHSDARPYVCEICKKTFNRVSTLISHRKTHSEQKPHTCDLCGKGFHQKGNLRNHIFTHTNERPYKCEACGKGFNQMSNLMCHKIKTHSRNPVTSQYICQLCEAQFPKRSNLQRHQEFNHNVKFKLPMRRKIDSEALRELFHKRKKKDGKNLRIIHLPNGDRTLADIRNIHAIVNSQTKQKQSEATTPSQDRMETTTMTGVLIDPIKTKAMANAKALGQTPFALLKPAKGIPVLVKVMPASNNKQMLVPATAEDLKSAGKVTVSPSIGAKDGEPMKAVQIKVPVVATVLQKFTHDGQLVIEVEPPSSEMQQQEKDQEQSQVEEAVTQIQPEEEDETECEIEEEEGQNDVLEDDCTETAMPTEFIKSETMTLQNDSMDDEEDEESSRITYIREDGSIIPEEEIAQLNPVNLLAAAVNLAQQHPSNEASRSLLELAAGGIRFVRPQEDGTFEIVTQEEATQIMSEGGQAVELIGDEQNISEIVGDEADDDPENPTNISALVDAIRAAGYQVGDGNKQIVISGEHGEHILLDDDQQIVFGESGEIIVLGEDGEQVQYVLQTEEEVTGDTGVTEEKE